MDMGKKIAIVVIALVVGGLSERSDRNDKAKETEVATTPSAVAENSPDPSGRWGSAAVARKMAPCDELSDLDQRGMPRYLEDYREKEEDCNSALGIISSVQATD